MKKILLLGDSIQLGYQKFVKEDLKNKCDVFYSEDNGRFTQYSYWLINQMYKEYGNFDVVHFNNGYWDMKIDPPMKECFNSIDEYLHGLRKIIKYAQDRGAKVIFATTIPIYKDSNTKIVFNNEDVVKYNNAALKLMKELDVEVNDLYSLMLKGDKYYKCDDMLHLTQEGSKVCAKQISDLLKL